MKTIHLACRAMLIAALLASVQATATPTYTATATGGTWAFTAADFSIADAEHISSIGQLDSGEAILSGCALVSNPVVAPYRDGYTSSISVELHLANVMWDGFVAAEGDNKRLFTVELSDGASFWQPHSIYLYSLDAHPRVEYRGADGRDYLSASSANKIIDLPVASLTAVAPAMTVAVCDVAPNVRFDLNQLVITTTYQKIGE